MCWKTCQVHTTALRRKTNCDKGNELCMMCNGVESENMCIMEWVPDTPPRIQLPLQLGSDSSTLPPKWEVKIKTPDNRPSQVNFNQDDPRRSKRILHEHCIRRSHYHGSKFLRNSWRFSDILHSTLQILFSTTRERNQCHRKESRYLEIHKTILFDDTVRVCSFQHDLEPARMRWKDDQMCATSCNKNWC